MIKKHMKKNKNQGLTLVETLIGFAIVGVILVLCSIGLLSMRKDNRDLKRISDMEVMRSTMAVIKVQFGSYSQAGCDLGAVYTCKGNNMKTLLPTIANFKDPSGKVLCSKNCTAPCQYDFTNIDENDFELLFYLEKGSGNYKEPGCYALTASGILKK